jgi:hypothetical protein
MGDKMHSYVIKIPTVFFKTYSPQRHGGRRDDCFFRNREIPISENPSAYGTWIPAYSKKKQIGFSLALSPAKEKIKILCVLCASAVNKPLKSYPSKG